MKKRIWLTHTGSAPGCQDTPTQQIRNWFQNEPIRLADASACLSNMLDLQQLEGVDDEDHRCFNRQDYALTFTDVRRIIRQLKDDAKGE